MVEALKVPKKVKPAIEYANLCQSFHIGINNYGGLKHKEYQNVYESHNDVEKYKNFFKNDLKYHKVYAHTD
jgi:hypothetical protein